MIKHVSVNIAGPYHIEKCIECQDSFCYKEVNEHIAVVAVADGLGSEKHSKIGSEIASHTAVEYIASLYSSDMDYNKVKSLMNNAFVYAYKAILDKVEEMNEDPDQFDTTLCLAIFDNQHLYFGQSGDSGMVALLPDGSYRNITETQNDESGCVFPLCEGPEFWKFGECTEPVSAIMLMTDGIYNRIVNKLFKYDYREYDGRRVEVNVPFAEMLMRRSEKTDEEIAEVQNQLNQFFKEYPKEKIDDDKTLVIIYDPDLPIDNMPEEYYRPADYTELHNKALAEYYRALGYSQESKTNERMEDNSEKTDSTSSADYESPDCKTNVNNEDVKETYSKGKIKSDEIQLDSEFPIVDNPGIKSTDSLQRIEYSKKKQKKAATTTLIHRFNKNS